MKRNLLIVFVSIISILLITVLVVSCTSSGSSSGKTPIKAAVAAPLTGSMSGDGIAMQKAGKLYEKLINEKGGILGRPVQMVYFDTKELLAETWQACAEYLVNQQKVDVVVAGYGGEAGPDVMGKYKVPYIHGESSEITIQIPIDNKYTNIFNIGDTGVNYGPNQAQAILKFAESANWEFPNKKVAGLTSPWTGLIQQSTGFCEELGKLGWETVLYQETADDTKEFGSIVEKIRSSKPSIIIFTVFNYAAMMQFKEEFMKDPWPCIILFSDCFALADYQDNVTEKNNGELGTFARGCVGKMGEELIKNYTAMFPNEKFAQAPVCPTYDGLLVWANAVEKVGNSTDYAKICEAIQSNELEITSGWARFGSDHRNSYKNAPQHIYQIQGGKVIELSLNDVMVPGAVFQIPGWIQQ
jgi:branched-chain amino acid transport system substrate-binding protein